MTLNTLGIAALSFVFLLSNDLARAEEKSLPGPVLMRLRLDNGDSRVLNFHYIQKSTTAAGRLSPAKSPEA